MQEANVVFDQAKEHSNAYNAKLGELMESSMEHYQKAPIRFDAIVAITKTEKPNPDQCFPVSLRSADKASQVKGLLALSERCEGEFRTSTRQLTDQFNGASVSMALMMTTFGLDEGFLCGEMGLSKETFDKISKLELRHPNLEVVKGKPAILAVLKFGPRKSFERAIEKELNDLNDLNRVTVEFQNTLALALYYFALCKRFKVVGMKNWFVQPGGFKRPPCVHMRLDWNGSGYLVEVMLMLTAFIEIKKAQHKVYEMTRAKNVADLLAAWELDRNQGVPDADPCRAQVERTEAKPLRQEEFMPVKLAPVSAEVARLKAENAALKAGMEAALAERDVALKGAGLPIPPARR